MGTGALCMKYNLLLICSACLMLQRHSFLPNVQPLKFIIMIVPTLLQPGWSWCWMVQCPPRLPQPCLGTQRWPLAGMTGTRLPGWSKPVCPVSSGPWPEGYGVAPRVSRQGRRGCDASGFSGSERLRTNPPFPEGALASVRALHAR